MKKKKKKIEILHLESIRNIVDKKKKNREALEYTRVYKLVYFDENYLNPF